MEDVADAVIGYFGYALGVILVVTYVFGGVFGVAVVLTVDEDPVDADIYKVSAVGDASNTSYIDGVEVTNATLYDGLGSRGLSLEYTVRVVSPAGSELPSAVRVKTNPPGNVTGVEREQWDSLEVVNRSDSGEVVRTMTAEVQVDSLDSGVESVRGTVEVYGDGNQVVGEYPFRVTRHNSSERLLPED